MARNKAELGCRGLEVWQVSMDLAVDVYRIVKLLPADERFSLSDQLRRAAVSIQQISPKVTAVEWETIDGQYKLREAH